MFCFKYWFLILYPTKIQPLWIIIIWPLFHCISSTYYTQSQPLIIACEFIAFASSARPPPVRTKNPFINSNPMMTTTTTKCSKQCIAYVSSPTTTNKTYKFHSSRSPTSSFSFSSFSFASHVRYAQRSAALWALNRRFRARRSHSSLARRHVSPHTLRFFFGVLCIVVVVT